MITELIKNMKQKQASSVHISVGLPPLLNINGRLIPAAAEKLSSDQIDDLANSLMNNSQAVRFKKERSINFTYILESAGRIRVNFYKQKGSTTGVFRTFSAHVPSFEKLNLPDNVQKYRHFLQ